MTLQKLTSEDKSSIQYFWEEKGDLTRWTGWKEKLDIIKSEYPELVRAVENLTIAERTISAIVKVIGND